MGGRGSGGLNRLSVQEHRARGTFKAHRHGHLTVAPPALDVSPADRRRVLAGLNPSARRLAVQLLERFTGWTPATRPDVLAALCPLVGAPRGAPAGAE